MRFYQTRFKRRLGLVIISQILLCTIIFTGINLVGLPTTEMLLNNTIGSKNTTTGYLLEWNVTYGTPYLDHGNGLAIGPDGCIFLVGDIFDDVNLNYDIFIAKYNWTGEFLFDITYDFSGEDDRGYGVAVNSTGFIFLVGSTANVPIVSESTRAALFFHYDPQGVKQANSYFIGSNNGDDVLQDVIVDANDNVYIAGTVNDITLGTQFYLKKYKPGVYAEWTALFGGSGIEEAYGIGVSSSNDVYVVGKTSSWVNGSTDACVVKYNSAGVKQWNATWGSLGSDSGMDIEFDGTNCLVVGSTAWSYATSYNDLYFSRFAKTSGAMAGWKSWHGSLDDFGYGIAKDMSGNFYLCGATWFADDYDAVVLKYDSSYNLQWNLTWGTPSNYDTSQEIALDSRNNIYIAGTTESYGAGVFDAYLAKFGRDVDGDGFTTDQELLAGTDPGDPNDYPGAPIPGFHYSYILLSLLLVLGVLMFLTKSNKDRSII